MPTRLVIAAAPTSTPPLVVILHRPRCFAVAFASLSTDTGTK
ncbi:hypothetical protein [Curtobacterium sp. ME12]|nr:hypothetical protein [Curtobacterium sp. ME12]